MGAAYQSAGCGLHLPSPGCTVLRRVGGIAPVPAGPIAGQGTASGNTSSSSRAWGIGKGSGTGQGVGDAGQRLQAPTMHPIMGPSSNHAQGFYPDLLEPLAAKPDQAGGARSGAATASGPAAPRTPPQDQAPEPGGVKRDAERALKGRSPAAGTGLRSTSASPPPPSLGAAQQGGVDRSNLMGAEGARGGSSQNSSNSSGWWANLRYTLDLLQRSLLLNRPQLTWVGWGVAWGLQEFAVVHVSGCAMQNVKCHFMGLGLCTREAQSSLAHNPPCSPRASLVRVACRHGSLQDDADAAFVVYLVPPSNDPSDALRCLLEAAVRLAPLTPVGAAAVNSMAGSIDAAAQAATTTGLAVAAQGAAAGTGAAQGAVAGAAGPGHAGPKGAQQAGLRGEEEVAAMVKELEKVGKQVCHGLVPYRSTPTCLVQ